MTLETATRNATLQDLASMLQDQHARKVDVVAPASKLRADNGTLVIEGADAAINADGVTTTDGRYVPTSVCDQQIAGKLGIPGGYLTRLRESRVDLYDANVNGWLHGFGHDRGIGGNIAEPRTRAEADTRTFMVRCFRDDDGDGIARAFLSDSYKIIDNLDVLTAALDGVRQAGAPVDIAGCDLNDRRMYVRVVAPQIAALAPTLLRNYRSPFSGASGADNPRVFAGLVISNSETGCGAFTITPRIVVQVCANGMTIAKDALRSVHLGSKLDEGVVRWSDETQQHNLTLVTSQTRDAVATFLDVDYVTAKIEQMEAKADQRLDSPAEAVEHVGKQLSFSQDRIASVLDHFIRSGDVTAGGVMQAVTATAQTVEDADEAFDMESQALHALDLAAAL